MGDFLVLSIPYRRVCLQSLRSCLLLNPFEPKTTTHSTLCNLCVTAYLKLTALLTAAEFLTLLLSYLSQGLVSESASVTCSVSSVVRVACEYSTVMYYVNIVFYLSYFILRRFTANQNM
jgi:hypothetical protein